MSDNHNLANTWVLWEQRSSDKKSMTAKEWADLQRKLFEFSTVEEFWRYYGHIPVPSQLFFDGRSRKRVGVPPDDRYIESFSLFKKGIAPEWEDKANINGGEWNLRKSGKNPDEGVDDWWQNLVLGLVGETIDPADHICGARVVDKSNGKVFIYRIELWLRIKDPEIIESLKNNMIQVMTEGKAQRGFADQFQWKLHGI